MKNHKSRNQAMYLVESQWSEDYTGFLRDIPRREMRGVDNSRLLDGKGRLRGDVRERVDYWKVSESVWKFVQQFRLAWGQLMLRNRPFACEAFGLYAEEDTLFVVLSC